MQANLFDTAPKSTLAVVRELQKNGQDFEFYPTSSRMTDVIRADIKTEFGSYYHASDNVEVSVLDCGAGDGRALKALSGGGRMFGIEKSEILIGIQPEDVIPVGTDFYQANLLDKPVDVCFSNPPYLQFESWSETIIRTANAKVVYLIIPVRWVESKMIARALELRKAEAVVLHTDDFLSADRAARARIDILKIDLRSKNTSDYRRNRDYEQSETDPFRIWFESTFPRKEELDSGESEEKLSKKVQHQMVNGKNLIEALVSLYNNELEHLQKNYAAAYQLDSALMKELGIKHEALLVALKGRIAGIKTRYWNEFFSNYDAITSRLTTDSRNSILSTLQSNTSVDFNESNALAITIWVIKRANTFFDSQLIKLVEKMVSKANIHLYKSNQRVYGSEDWRYTRWSDTAPRVDHYSLDYRIVLDSMGGINNSGYSWERSQHAGLDSYAAAFLSDILAVAGTLGWDVRRGVTSRHWTSNSLQEFWAGDKLLCDIRAFKKGTMHIRFNSQFIKKLNCEFGRLQGWIKSKEEAAEELNLTPEEAQEFFGSNLNLLANSASKFLALSAPSIANDSDQLALAA
jgi:hypothetical protein